MIPLRKSQKSKNLPSLSSAQELALVTGRIEGSRNTKQLPKSNYFHLVHLLIQTMIKWQEGFDEQVDFSNWDDDEITSKDIKELSASNIISGLWDLVKERKAA